MTDTITGMRTEHTNLLKLLYVLQRQMEIFAAGANPGFDLMQDILDYNTNYFERVHHSKEETMMAHLARQAHELQPDIARIHEEHEQISQLTHKLTGTLDDIIIGSSMTPRESVVNMIQEFINLNREHIRHEEQVIFPAAIKNLKDKHWQEIEESVPADDDPLFGKEVKDQYQNLYQSIMEENTASTSE